MARKPAAYTNESITSLKGADRVRKRPGVIFGSDGVDGCAHSIFEILSNAIDEAREGYGNRILITKFKDGSVEVEDFGRGMPVDYNKNEQRYNWELLFCEMYAGGKYSAGADNYEYSLGLNGLGLCATQTSYENQTKKAITNKFIQQAMTEFLKHNLEVYFIEKPDEAMKLAQQVLVNKQSREHADKVRQGAKKTLSAQIDIANRVQKFVDCRSKDLARREIYIVEGDSAMGAVKTSRDSEFQAIMPVRGKILNCLKADYDRIFKSDIITDLIKVLGCGVELGGKGKKDLSSFDIANLRWSKVIICTDADVDGYQIRTLILTMIYRLVPSLIEEGYVYIAESPLYEIESKGKTYFAYTEPEKAEFLKRIGGAKYTIQRSKGLGENDAEMMWLTTMNPETRRLIKVTPEDAKRTGEVFDLLLGDNLAGRKEHIANHGYEYLDELDVS